MPNAITTVESTGHGVVLVYGRELKNDKHSNYVLLLVGSDLILRIGVRERSPDRQRKDVRSPGSDWVPCPKAHMCIVATGSLSKPMLPPSLNFAMPKTCGY